MPRRTGPPPATTARQGTPQPPSPDLVLLGGKVFTLILDILGRRFDVPRGSKVDITLTNPQEMMFSVYHDVNQVAGPSEAPWSVTNQPNFIHAIGLNLTKRF